MQILNTFLNRLYQIDLIWGSRNFLYFKVIGDPKTKVAKNQEGHHLEIIMTSINCKRRQTDLLVLLNLSSWFCPLVFFSNAFVLQVGNEQKLQVDL